VDPSRQPRAPFEVAPQRHRHGDEDLALLVWRFPEPRLVVSSAPSGGGIGLRWWVLNAQVPHDYARCDPDAHVGELAASLGLRGPGVGMLTAVDVRTVTSAVDLGVHVDATVGLTHPVWASAPGDPGDPTERGATPVAQRRTGSQRAARHRAGPGTVNVVAFVGARLGAAALVNAVGTATEAKAQALWGRGVPGTGTASDALCVVCPAAGPEEPFGGPRSLWGARLARAVHDAVLAGCDAGGLP